MLPRRSIRVLVPVMLRRTDSESHEVFLWQITLPASSLQGKGITMGHLHIYTHSGEKTMSFSGFDIDTVKEALVFSHLITILQPYAISIGRILFEIVAGTGTWV